jgi:hypothetical protein
LPPITLSQNLWSANASTASLIETEEAARGEHILDEATVAHRISALRQLNGATRTGHRYAKSTGARNSTFNQPVIVRTYSETRRQRRPRELPVKKEIQNMGKAELPPVEAFSFKGIMESIQSGVAEDLERIAEICARSRYSLSNQYEVHMPPHGDGDPFLLNTPGNAMRTGGPTLEAIASDDELPRLNGRPSRGNRQRAKSMAYGTLETIYSSSKSSEEDKSKKKPAKVIAEEVRGRAARKAPPVSAATIGTLNDQPDNANQIPRPKQARSQSASFASRLIDSVQTNRGDAATRFISPSALISEPARPQTSITEQDPSNIDGFVNDPSNRLPPVRHDSRASNPRVVSDQRTSVFSNLSSWLPWSRTADASTGSTSERPLNKSYAEGSLRELLKSSDADRKGKGVDRVG